MPFSDDVSEREESEGVLLGHSNVCRPMYAVSHNQTHLYAVRPKHTVVACRRRLDFAGGVCLEHCKRHHNHSVTTVEYVANTKRSLHRADFSAGLSLATRRFLAVLPPLPPLRPEPPDPPVPPMPMIDGVVVLGNL